MTNNVSRLDDASHTVRLAAGAMFDGMRNGNMLTPAVAMMPKMPSALAIKAKPGRRAEINNQGKTGTEQAQAPAPRSSTDGCDSWRTIARADASPSLSNGLDGPSAAIGLVMA